MAVQPVLGKSWQRTTVLLLLGAAVVGVATLAISDVNPNAEKAPPEPASRTLRQSTTPDLSVAGFRIGSLAVSLVGNLFSGTQSLLNSSAPEVTSTATTGVASTESSIAVESLAVTPGTSAKMANSTTSTPEISPPSTSRTTGPATIKKSESTSPSSIPTTTTTTTTTTTPVSVATTLPVSAEPLEESLEPAGEPTIFGQLYLGTWPSLQMWERMAWCESRQTWDVDTGNGYFGGLQFALGSWQWMGGEGSPANASKEEQIYRANLLWQAQGWNGWPGCKAYFGWSRWQVNE